MAEDVAGLQKQLSAVRQAEMSAQLEAASLRATKAANEARISQLEKELAAAREQADRLRSELREATAAVTDARVTAAREIASLQAACEARLTQLRAEHAQRIADLRWGLGAGAGRGSVDASPTRAGDVHRASAAAELLSGHHADKGTAQVKSPPAPRAGAGASGRTTSRHASPPPHTPGQRAVRRQQLQSQRHRQHASAFLSPSSLVLSPLSPETEAGPAEEVAEAGDARYPTRNRSSHASASAPGAASRSVAGTGSHWEGRATARPRSTSSQSRRRAAAAATATGPQIEPERPLDVTMSSPEGSHHSRGWAGQLDSESTADSGSADSPTAADAAEASHTADIRLPLPQLQPPSKPASATGHAMAKAAHSRNVMHREDKHQLPSPVVLNRDAAGAYTWATQTQASSVSYDHNPAWNVPIVPLTFAAPGRAVPLGLGLRVPATGTVSAASGTSTVTHLGPMQAKVEGLTITAQLVGHP
jgi:hypothetical protein